MDIPVPNSFEELKLNKFSFSLLDLEDHEILSGRLEAIDLVRAIEIIFNVTESFLKLTGKLEETDAVKCSITDAPKFDITEARVIEASTNKDMTKLLIQEY